MEMAMPFLNRSEAGRRLVERLTDLRGKDVVVLGLPRGGVPVAFEVAQALGAPLDVIVVRKLGVPLYPELGLGAIGEGGVRVLNEAVVRMAQVSELEVEAVENRERAELDRRSRRFRGDRVRIPVTDRIAVVVDDGIATGSTARAACQVARALGAGRVILAVPVAPRTVVADLSREVEVVCVETPEDLRAIGEWYQDFRQTPDEEVVTLLRLAGHPAVGAARGGSPSSQDPLVREDQVRVAAGQVGLTGHLTMPEGASGIVVFAHGSGSSRHSPRNRFVAAALNRARLGTLLFDLLTPAEEMDRANVFDIDLLARRLTAATSWLKSQPEALGLPVGYFGASTGAAAALWAAAEPDADIAAVVSRGGRPDLAKPRLGRVHTPTLLIVGGHDHTVLRLNRRAQSQMVCKNHLAVVPGATHLFEEPGALAEVSLLARDWFVDHLVRWPTRPPHSRLFDDRVPDPVGHMLDRITDAGVAPIQFSSAAYFANLVGLERA
jgi:putative phosphoribosyl transferase